MSKNGKGPNPVSRRNFLKTAVSNGAAGVAVAAVGLHTKEAEAQNTAAIKWDKTADVVVVGAGVSGLACMCAARDAGATVIAIDENFDIGGRGILSGGSIALGGGHSMQTKLGYNDTPDSVFQDWIRHDSKDTRYNDRDIVRKIADENAPTFEFLLKHGVQFTGQIGGRGRSWQVVEWHVPSQTMAPFRGRHGSGLVRRLEESARKMGVEILLKHQMTRIIREQPRSGRVLGVAVKVLDGGKEMFIRGTKGVYVGTGGNSGNVNFRRTFDPRLTEEYQQACMPYTRQSGDAEVQSMALGASLWGTANQTAEEGSAIVKTGNIGCQWGYDSLVVETFSPLFKLTGGTGLQVNNWHDVILVNQLGKRFWNELDSGYDFLSAAMAYIGDPVKLNGGGPIWAIFDSDAVTRNGWNPKPPNVNPLWFASGATIQEVAANVGTIKNPYQKKALPAAALQETVERYNSFVTSGTDTDFKKPKPAFKIEKPPFYAAWSTPILHDSLTGLRVNANMQVMDIFGEVIPGLYTGGESAGGFSQHGLARDLTTGRIAGLHAGKASGSTQ